MFARIAKSSKENLNFVRFSSSNNNILTSYTNRNPRSLEKLQIGYKPNGYHLEMPGKCFWNKLEVTETNRYVTAEIVHFERGPFIEVSTKDWAIKKLLYRCTDTSAYINLSRILAQRMKESDITEIFCSIQAKPNTKLAYFLETLTAEGIKLEEPEQYKPPNPTYFKRPEKPWLKYHKE